MTKSDFTVKCPYCEKTNDFSGDDWRDELIDDSDSTEIDCMHCDYPMTITTRAIYILEVEPYIENTSGPREDTPYSDY